jgi:hypothetical protein
MPVIIDQHTVSLRTIWLELDRQKLIDMQPDATDEDMRELERLLLKNEGKLEEMQDWMRILNKDPGWGDLINVEGRQVPRMPKFKSPEERQERLANWPSAKGHDEDYVRRAREFRAAEDAQDDARFLDGIGPIAEEERLEEIRNADGEA